MSMPQILGVTGSIGMGKTTVSTLLSQLFNAPIFDADQHVAILYNSSEVISSVAHHYPEYIQNDKIDKILLSEQAFTDVKLRVFLEKTFYPLLRSQLNVFIKTANYRKFRYLILDIPLLFEAKFNSYCTKTITVHCHPSIQRQRVLRRSNMTIEKLQQINQLQWPTHQKIALSDHNINTGQHKGAIVQQLKLLY